MLQTLADLDMALAESRRFYEAHGLTKHAKGLPGLLRLARDAERSFIAGVESGLTRAFAFPPTRVQRQGFHRTLEALAAVPAPGLPDAQQYATPAVADLDRLRAVPVRNRPDGPYLLLYGDDEVPEETRGVAPAMLERRFREKGWSSLTAGEYLVVQRREAERHGDHRFDDYGAGDDAAQCLCLLDSRDGSAIVAACWNPAKRRVELGWCRAAGKSRRRGARPTMVVELEED